MTLRRKILLLILGILVVFNVWNFSQINLKWPSLDRQLPDPIPVVTGSFHEDGDNESWIMKVENDGSVWVQMVDDKTNIHFRPSSWHWHLFSGHINQLAAVTFECGKEPEEECNLSEPFKLYVKNVQVELIEVKKK